MKSISRNDQSLNWLGRWVDDGGKYSGWGGSALQFNFTGTSLEIEVDVKNPGGIAVMIDDYSGDWTRRIELKQDGVSVIKIVEGLEDKEHTAFLRFWSKNYKNKREGIDYVKVRSILIDDNATVSKWSGKFKIGYFGDSWASADNDFLRFLGLKDVEVHSISDPGYSAKSGLKRYSYVVGEEPIKDIPFDTLVLGYGVNDAYGRLFFSHKWFFRRNIKKLVNKIRANNPSVKIILLQSPNNHDAEKDTSRYGEILKRISKKVNNSIYISSKEIENKLTWKPDGVHLDTNGKHIYGKWLGEKLGDYLRIN